MAAAESVVGDGDTIFYLDKFARLDRAGRFVDGDPIDDLVGVAETDEVGLVFFARDRKRSNRNKVADKAVGVGGGI